MHTATIHMEGQGSFAPGNLKPGFVGHLAQLVAQGAGGRINHNVCLGTCYWVAGHFEHKATQVPSEQGPIVGMLIIKMYIGT